MNKIGVGILGANGLIGQYYISLLENHPWFEITFLGGSVEGPYAPRDWQFQKPPPQLMVHKLDAIDVAERRCRFIFSALSSELAAIYEEKYATAGLGVISNASYHRMQAPLVIPEVNPECLDTLGESFIVTKPNCALQSFAIALTPLHRRFGVKKLVITTIQAVGGAGLSGLSALGIQDTVLPFIAGEEEKIENEMKKIWCAPDLKVAAHCTRAPFSHGHLATLSVAFETTPTREEILEIWEEAVSLRTPLAPHKLITYSDTLHPKRDRDRENGMGVTVGRLRPCPVLDWRFVSLTHNAVRGGAGGGILIAEALVKNEKKRSIREVEAELSLL